MFKDKEWCLYIFNEGSQNHGYWKYFRVIGKKVLATGRNHWIYVLKGWRMIFQKEKNRLAESRSNFAGLAFSNCFCNAVSESRFLLQIKDSHGLAENTSARRRSPPLLEIPLLKREEHKSSKPTIISIPDRTLLQSGWERVTGYNIPRHG